MKKEVTIDGLDDILIEYFQIFVKEPEKGSAAKILKFLKKEEEKAMNFKTFVSDFREEFPSALTNLKDYYALKLKKL